MVIGNSRIEGIDWVHKCLNYIARPLAEQTYKTLLQEGKIEEKDGEVVLTTLLSEDEVRAKAVEEDRKKQRTMTKMIYRRKAINTKVSKMNKCFKQNMMKTNIDLTGRDNLQEDNTPPDECDI